MKRVLSAATLLFMISTIVHAADWPRFLGPDGNGVSPITGIRKNWNEQPPRELWRVEMSDRGYSGPAVAGGRLFIIDRDGETDVVRAIDLDNGQNVWTFSYSDPGRANYGYARATPVIDDGRVYTLGRNGHLHCLKADDGTLIWSRNILADFQGKSPSWQMSMSPVVDGDKLIITPGGSRNVASLNKLTGETIWQGGSNDMISYATPVVATIDNVKQYVIFTSHGLMGVKADDGALLWRQEWRTRHDVNAAVPIVVGNTAFISSGYGRGCAMVAISKRETKILWENKEVVAHFSSPLLYRGYIYANSDPEDLVCLEPRTGKAMWRQKGFGKGGLMIIDGVIIAIDGNGGNVIMVQPDTERYVELGRFRPLGGQSWTAPIAADGKLIIRNQQALAAFDLR